MKSENEIIAIANELINRDRQRNLDFEAYHKMYHSEWTMPPELAEKEWILKIVNTEPASKINAATRAMARLEPKISVTPLYENESSKEWANRLEYILKWNLNMANRRRSATIWWDYAFSAVMYDMISAQVVDLDYMIKEYNIFGGDTSRLTAARKKGRFLVNVYNPKNVHAVNSDIMEEGVLLVQEKKVIDVINEFGKELTKDLQKLVSSEQELYGTVVLYDYWDYDQRFVWAQPGSFSGMASNRITIIPPTKPKYPFSSWVIAAGSTSIEEKEELKYKPLLFTILKATQWELSNIVDSMITSKSIATAGVPILKEEGTSGRSADINYDDPMTPVQVPAGDQLNVMTPPPLDVRMLELRQEIAAKMSTSLPEVLTTLEPAQSEPYASYALRLTTAIGALAPWIKITENALADTCLAMVNWAHYTKEGLYAYGNARDNAGKQYYIAWNEIDPEQVYIDVSMTTDAPTDRIGNINAAAIAVNSLGMSQETALEQIGIFNPQQEMRRRFFEKLMNHVIELRLKKHETREMAKVQLEIEQQRMEMQSELQNQSQYPNINEQEPQYMPPESVSYDIGSATGNEAIERQNLLSMQNPQGIPGIEGQGFNPAAGGVPPALVMPGATREYQQTTGTNPEKGIGL